jgi:hypothetical protein
MNRLDDGPPMKRQHTKRQSKLVEVASRNGSCQHENGAGYCKHPETQRNISRCKYAIRANKLGEEPCIVCEREL